MARIVFVMDIEEGHILASFGLAGSLKKKGHDVIYLSIPDNEKFVKDEGFDFCCVFSKLYPPGYRKIHKQKQGREYLHEPTVNYIDEVIGGAYDLLGNELNADLFIVSAFLRFDMLIMYYRYGISPVVFTPYLRDKGVTLLTDAMGDLLKMPPQQSFKLINYFNAIGVSFQSLNALLEPFNSFTELVACPPELEIDGIPLPGTANYIGPSIRHSSGWNDEFGLGEIARDKKIIYVSLGSQAISHKELTQPLFSKMVHIMKRPDFRHLHMVLMVGQEFETQTLPDRTDNVTITKWTVQAEVLKLASLAVVHGGMGTLKDCIYYGVPVIVLPITRDQPSNGRRAAYHKLGVEMDIRTASEADIASNIYYVLESEEIKANVYRMQQIFRTAEEKGNGVELIERLLVKESMRVETTK